MTDRTGDIFNMTRSLSVIPDKAFESIKCQLRYYVDNIDQPKLYWDKYYIVLDILNKILINGSCQPITSLLECTIPRNVMLLPGNTEIINDSKTLLFSVFTPSELGWYNRGQTKCVALYIIRRACNQIGFKVQSTAKVIKHKDVNYFFVAV